MPKKIDNFKLNKKKVEAFVIATLFPFWGMVYSFLNRKQTWLKNIFWLACAYTGLVFIFNPMGGGENDFTRYAATFQEFSNSNITLKEIFSNAFTTGIYKDLFLPLFMYTLSFFSKDPKFFFFSFAIVFGYFFSRNLWFVFEELPEKQNIYILILLMFYFLAVPFWGLVRIWLSIHIFVYGAMPYVYKKDKSKIIWAFASFLVHFAMIFPLLVFVLYVNLPKRINLFMIVYSVSLFINEIDLQIVHDLLSGLFPFMEGSVESYANEAYAEYRKNIEYTWHVGFSETISHYTMVFLIFLTYLNIKKHHKQNSPLIRLYTFSLLIYGAANIFALVPSGGRFIFLSQLFMVPATIFSFVHLNQKSHFYSFLRSSLFLLIPILFKIRLGLGFYGISLFFGNFFSAQFWNDNVPLIDVIKNFLY